MLTIGIGVIGWGFMGKTHTHALRSMPLFYPDAGFLPKLVGVCSHSLSKAQAACDEMGFTYATDDYHDLLKDENISVVSICTPNGLHEQMAIDALHAGKNVYIDKPLSVDYASALRIADAARTSKGKAQLVLNNRFFPATMRAKQLIREGKIGDILTFSARYLHSGSIDPAKPMGWKQGKEGGVLLDIGSHALDLLTWLIGMPEKVLCETNTLYSKRPTRAGTVCNEVAEDHALMMLKMPNGALGTAEASKITTGSPDELAMEICGTAGALRWNLKDPGWLEYFDNTQPERDLGGLRGFTRIECLGRYPAPGGVFLPSKNCIGWDRGHMHCYYSFLDCVANNRQPSPSIEEAVKLQRLLERMRMSARLHTWMGME